MDVFERFHKTANLEPSEACISSATVAVMQEPMPSNEQTRFGSFGVSDDGHMSNSSCPINNLGDLLSGENEPSTQLDTFPEFSNSLARVNYLEASGLGLHFMEFRVVFGISFQRL